MDAGLLSGIIGGCVGVAGGAIGTYFSVKNTKTPRERAFMVKAAVVSWIATLVFVTLVLTLPEPYDHLMWIPYAILLSWGIVACNKKQAELRQREMT